MATKSKTIATPASLHSYTVNFWSYVETKCTVHIKVNGVWLDQSTTDREFFGLRISDTINVPLKDGTTKRMDVNTLWRRFGAISGNQTDILAASFAAVNAGMLKSYNSKGRREDNKGKSYGVKFWTINNPKAAESRKGPSPSAIDMDGMDGF